MSASGFGFEEEEEDGNPITKKALKALIKKHNLYNTAELNDVLYLHYQGFTRICNLHPFTNLKALWLNNNAISRIEGLDELRNLSCLYLANNIIDSLSGLDNLVSLDTLSLSHNYISVIEGLHNCVRLTTVELDHNKFRQPAGLAGLLAAPTIAILNLNNNDIESEEFAEVIRGLDQLRVLRMVGNPVVRQMRDYRRRLILQFQELRFLDDAPVEDDERRCVAAWAEGGIPAERAERAKIKEEKDAKHEENMRKFRELQGKKIPPEADVEDEQVRDAQGEVDPFFVTEQTGDVVNDVD
jgi:dynein assembly factor 1